jgi:AcrR family transcriptional regulator
MTDDLGARPNGFDRETESAERRRLSPDDRREQILLAARQAFSESGRGGTTMREVAVRAGITETHLYRHFRKEELFGEAILAPLSELESRVISDTRALTAQPGTSRSELLKHFHELCLSYFLQLAPLLRAGTLRGARAGGWMAPDQLFPRWSKLVSVVIAEVTGWEPESLNLDVMVKALMGLYLVTALESVLADATLDVSRAAADLTAMFAPSRLDASARPALARAAVRADAVAGTLPAEPVAADARAAMEPGTGGLRRRLSKAERRASILLAARELFGEVGLSGARSRNIAERAEITETFLYRHFSSKEEIYAEAIERPAEAALREYAAAVGELAASQDGAAFMLELNGLALRFFVEHGALLATALLSDLDRSRRFYLDRVRPQLDVIGAVVLERMSYSSISVSPVLARQAIMGAQWGVTLDLGRRPMDVGLDALSLHLTRLFTLGVNPLPRGASSAA